MNNESQDRKQKDFPLTNSNYQILQTIGTGTFGKVFLVKQKSTNDLFALKHVFQNKKYKNRQLQIMQMIKSQFIIPLKDSFYTEENNGVFLNLVMEYMPQTLSKTIKSNLLSKKFMNASTVISYSKCLLTALKDLQSAGICHRDIKPSNILINQKEVAKLCDFGSAKLLAPQQKNISYICSRYYRAPELVLGASFYSSKVDIWSAGCVIAQMLTNHSLFQGSNNTSLLMKIIRTIGCPSEQDIKAMKLQSSQIEILHTQGVGLANRIKKLNPNADERIITLIQKMIVYNPDLRMTPKQALQLPVFLP